MQYSAVAVLALAATASASYNVSTPVVSYTTEVYTEYTTVCPAATELTYNGVTYTATESTTLTITNCPCTVVKPVTTSSYVYCATCTPVAPTYTPVYPTTNGTTTAPAVTVAPTGSYSAAPTATQTQVAANGANQAMAFSGASLAGLLGLAAYIL